MEYQTYESILYDVIIIGAGPIGLACGIEAAKHQLNYCIIDKGCLVNALYHYPTNMTFFSTADKLEIGGVPFVSHNDKPTRREALEYYRRVKNHWDIPVKAFEELIDLQHNGMYYELTTTKGGYTTAAVIIATGFFDTVNKLKVIGEDLPKVKHYFDDAHPYDGQQVAVIGAGNSAVHAALETYRKGADVTMIIRGNGFKENIKYWLLPDIQNRIVEGSIKAYFNSEVSYIDQYQITVNTPDNHLVLANDFVLAMTGYQPNFTWLQHLGIEIIESEGFRIPKHNSYTHETNLSNVFLAGTVCGGSNTSAWYIENARDHAVIIMRQIATGIQTRSY